MKDLFFCGKCSAPMRPYKSTSSKKVVTYSYRCASKNHKACDLKNVDAAEAEKAVVESYKKWIKDVKKSKLVKSLINFNPSQAEIAPMKAELVKVEFELANVTSAIKQGARYDDLRKEAEELSAKKAELRSCLEKIVHFQKFEPKLVEEKLTEMAQEEVTKEMLHKYIGLVLANEDGSLSIFYGFNPYSAENPNLYRDEVFVARFNEWRPL